MNLRVETPRRCAAVLLLLMVFSYLHFGPARAYGQATSANILGVVTDETGAIVPGAALTITNVETGITRTTTTDESGRYRVQNLPVGSYQVDASFSGFRSVTRRGITLTVGQSASVDVRLQVGDVAERVEVTAEAPLVDTNTAVLGGLVDQKSIQDLPLNGRSFIELANLQAGTVNAITGGRSESQGYGQKLSISGGRFTSNVFLLDGTVMNDMYGSAGGTADGIAAGVDTVREFKVITNSYSAEYGQHTGGVINAVTKNGTNDLHGSVYEFLRNDNLDAMRWEQKARVAGKAVKPEFRRNQFGASLGGPIRRDRTFYFSNFEGLREAVGTAANINIPDARARLGFLPSTSTAAPDAVECAPAAPPCEVNVGALNAAGFAKVRPFFDKLWPIPPGAALTQNPNGTLTYTRSESDPTRLNYLSSRVDHHLSDNDSLFGRYTIDHADREAVSYNTIGNQRTRSQFVTLQYDRIISPAVLNSANAGFTRNFTGVFSISFPGFERVTFSDSQYGHGVVSAAGITTTGSGNLDPRIFILNNYQARDDMTINRGSHTIKIGGNFSRLQHNDTSPRQPAGQFSFQSLEDLLRNNVNEALISLAENFVRHTRQSIFGAYFQDDWQITRRFTLNWGVRWEMASSPKFAADLKNLMPVALEENFFALDASGANLFGPEQIEQRDSLFLSNPSYNNFAPRVGFAWDVFGDGKTSLRGGTGIFHEQLLYWTYRLALLHTAPLFVEGRLTNPLLAPRGLTVDFPNAYFTQRDLFVGNPRYESFQKTPNQPYVGKFSLEIQREVLPAMLVRLGYSGTRGVHLPNRQEQNGRRPTVLTDGTLFFPTTNPAQNTRLGRTRHRRTSGTSDYHSLRFEVEKRLSHGLQLQGNYTWAKNIDDGTSVTGGTDFSNDPVPRYYTFTERGLAATDVRHAFTFNSTYSLPGASLSGWAGQALGGWRLNGLMRVQAGLPIGVVTGFDRSQTIEGGNYPNLSPGASNNPVDGNSAGCTLQTGNVFRFGNTTSLPAGTQLRSPELWFDPCVFQLPTAGFLGNLGRNTVTGPGSVTVDLSVAKTFSLAWLHENTRLEFRGELFNAFNLVNFNAPAAGVFVTASGTTGRPGGSAGLITGTQGAPRKIQFGLKFSF